MGGQVYLSLQKKLKVFTVSLVSFKYLLHSIQYLKEITFEGPEI